MKRRMLLLTLTLPLLMTQQVQAQSSSRLIARANLKHNGALFVPTDSTVYTFGSINRGGDLNHTMKHDLSTTWLYVGFTSFQNQYRTLQTFDSHNNVTSMTNQYWDGGTWIMDGKMLYNYDAKNRLKSNIKQTWGGTVWLNVTRDTNVYNDANQLITVQTGTWVNNTSSFDSTSGVDYTYDAVTNNLVNETAYDILSTSGRYFNTATDYVYTNINQLLSATYSKSSTGLLTSFKSDRRVTNAYDSVGNMISRFVEKFDLPNYVWRNDSFCTFTGFVNHMPLSQVVKYWDNTGGGSWMNRWQHTYSYNTANQLTSEIKESWNVGGFWEFAAGDPRTNYYYGAYTSVAAVKNLSNANGDASIYPVPAQSMLHIDVKWENAQAATISIMDMAGRVIQSWEAPYGTDYRSAISINDLATGNYIVNISGTNGQIVKQISVAH